MRATIGTFLLDRRFESLKVGARSCFHGNEGAKACSLIVKAIFSEVQTGCSPYMVLESHVIASSFQGTDDDESAFRAKSRAHQHVSLIQDFFSPSDSNSAVTILKSERVDAAVWEEPEVGSVEFRNRSPDCMTETNPNRRAKRWSRISCPGIDP